MRHDGSLCDVDQHILALIGLWFRLAQQDVCLCTVLLSISGVVCAVGSVDSCIYFGIAAVLFPQSGTFFRSVGVGETLCLDVAAAAQRHPRHHQVAERQRWVWVGVVF